jgi:16S rRNA (guanine527-N7)-methyltransferase
MTGAATGPLPGIPADAEPMLQAFAGLVLKWNRQINLISRASEAEIWQRHILDSAQLFPLAPDHAKLWLDIGSGGGFPGLVIAILAHHRRPAMEVVLVESDKRKAAFLRQAARTLGLSCRIRAERVESLPPMKADVLSARALAPLAELLGYAARLVAPGGVMIFPKGERAEEEIREACQDWRFGVERIQSATSHAASVLKLTDVHHA